MGIFKTAIHMLFGGEESKNNSGNKAYDALSGSFMPVANQTGAASGAMGNILGLGGSGAMSQALNDYYNSAGGKFQLGQGLDALTSKYSALGLTHSGAAMEGMEEFRQGLASTYLDNYLNHLNDLARIGLGAGGIVSDAGQYSSGSGDKETGGLGKFIGAVLSDRRLKTKIRLLHRDPDGLGWYEFAYKADPKTMFVGVMADEVKRLRPAAYVPGFVNGQYDGVNYARLAA